MDPTSDIHKLGRKAHCLWSDIQSTLYRLNISDEKCTGFWADIIGGQHMRGWSSIQICTSLPWHFPEEYLIWMSKVTESVLIFTGGREKRPFDFFGTPYNACFRKCLASFVQGRSYPKFGMAMGTVLKDKQLWISFHFQKGWWTKVEFKERICPWHSDFNFKASKNSWF